MTLAYRSPFWVLVMQRGPLSLLDNAYLMVSFLVGTWLYVSGLRSAPSLFRKQAIILVSASFVPFVGYFAFLADLTPWGLDITPVTLGVSCALLYIGIFNYGIFNLAPLARNLIFNSMRDAVLILDNSYRLLDFNPAAEDLLPFLNRKALGVPVAHLMSDTPELPAIIKRGQLSTEFKMGTEESSPSFEIHVWPLAARPGLRPVGLAVVFADVTAQVHLREELRLRAETDPLTGVANRRRFHQALEIECLRFARGRAPLSVLMIDLDFFKEVNDHHGHPVGDTVLRKVADLLLASVRKTDVLARYGGEEFSVLLPDTRVEGATVIAEKIRLSVGGSPLQVDGLHIPLTVSVGVASHATDFEVDPAILLKKADLALYRAKATGRNRVEVM